MVGVSGDIGPNQNGFLPYGGKEKEIGTPFQFLRNFFTAFQAFQKLMPKGLETLNLSSLGVLKGNIPGLMKGGKGRG